MTINWLSLIAFSLGSITGVVIVLILNKILKITEIIDAFRDWLGLENES